MVAHLARSPVAHLLLARLGVGTAGRPNGFKPPRVPHDPTLAHGTSRMGSRRRAGARTKAREQRQPPCRQIAVQKKGRQPLSGDSAAPNLGLLLCRREEPHTSDTCGRLASMPKWGAGEAGSADQRGRCFISCDATARWPTLFSRDLRLRAAQRSSNAAADLAGSRRSRGARSLRLTLGQPTALTGVTPVVGQQPSSEQKRNLSQARAHRLGGGAPQYRSRSNLSNSSPGCSRCPVRQAS
jgi:hypothetical protein